MPGTLRQVRLGLLLLGALTWAASVAAQPPDYPPTPSRPVMEELHGETIVDPYRWLEDGNDAEVQAWTTEQNRLTRRLLDRFEDQRAQLKKQLRELHAVNVCSAPKIFGDRFFFLKRNGLQNRAVLYVREGSLTAEPRVVLDPNEFSADGTVSLDWWYPSPDGALLAYGKSTGGSEMSTLYLRDVKTGANLDLVIPHTRHAALAWDADGGGFTYTRYPAPGTVPAGDEHYYRHIYYHKLGLVVNGSDWNDDPKIWGAGQPKEVPAEVSNSSDNRYQFLSVSFGYARNDLYVRKMGTPDFRPVAVGLNGLFDADALGERLFIHTNHEAPRYRIVVADVSGSAPENWQDVIPEQNGVIHDFALADGKLVVHVMENAYSRLLIYESDGKLIKEIELPTLGSVRDINGRPDRSELFFRFESFAHPPVVFHYDLREHTMNVLDRMAVDADLEQYETRQVWFNSQDGTRVPMFVTHKKGLELDGRNPAILHGYGGFNISLKPTFERDCLPWLDHGGVWAVANIRGGGEFGQDWHLAGRLEKKQNCFDDFIAAAEKLIADGYTSPERLGAVGGSNGGLLTGAMLVQRPDLFRAVVCAVPLLDMIRYHKFALARFWIPEYGTAEDPEQFKFLHAYSPYHHVTAGVAYPAALFLTAAGDSRVDPLHARKMAARMQSATVSDSPILLWVESQAGHANAAKPLSKYIDDQVDLWTFFMWQLGVFDQAAQTQPASTMPVMLNEARNEQDRRQMHR
ncbi:MAG: S9 family peptidase [Phycisphaerae bacterium]|nr:S9 family peptidase [Phycisphaerae bacterium]